MQPQAPALEFPCRYPLKIFGHDHPDFADLMLELVRSHAEDVSRDDLNSNTSRNGRYLALTITITATSQVQLDNIYRALTSHERVVMAL